MRNAPEVQTEVLRVISRADRATLEELMSRIDDENAMTTIARHLGATSTDVLVLREGHRGSLFGEGMPCGVCGSRETPFAWASTERNPMRLAPLCEPCALDLSGGIRP